jgi:PAS domain S-box-containing protein
MAQMALRSRPRRQLLLNLAPVAIFLPLAALTLLVWRQQVAHKLTLLQRHSDDVCFQASRRIEVLVDSLLRTATLFALHWPIHAGRDNSEDRFREFAGELTSTQPGFHSLRLIPADGGKEWAVPGAADPTWRRLGGQRAALLARARQRGGEVLSRPVTTADGQTSFFVVLPLGRGQASPGYLVAELRLQALISQGFHRRLRSEFRFQIRDAGTLLYHLPGDSGAPLKQATIRSSHRLTIRDRNWQVITVLRDRMVAGLGWGADLAVPSLGLLLSVGLALLVHLLVRRMALVRAARDQALDGIAKLEQAHQALRASEARYRSVFNSATDGMLVLDGEGQIVDSNPAARAMHGYVSPEFEELTVLDLIAPEHQHLYREFRRQIQDFGAARLDSVHRRRDGSTLDVEVRGTSFQYGGEALVLDIMTDVSDRRLAVQRHAQLSRKVLMAQEEERARVSRELHDELGQLLTAIRLELDWLHRTAETEPVQAAGAFGNAVQMVENAAEELRRICRGLRPPLLDDLGLEPSVRALVDEFEERSRIRAVLEIDLDEDPPQLASEVALCTYRILQEALNNVSRHARASQVNITLTLKDRELRLTVYDDGRGFDLASAQPPRGVGLDGMRERAFLVDGTLDIRSENMQGTRVVFFVPLAGEGSEEGD